MIGINDVVEKLVDDVYIRGISPSQPFKPMTDNELNIDQELTTGVLKEIAGGPHIRIYDIGLFVGPIDRVGFDVGPVGRVGFDIGPIGRRV